VLALGAAAFVGLEAGASVALGAALAAGNLWLLARIGTSLLPAAVVGSGIMGERLAGGNVGVALLANTLATGAALVALGNGSLLLLFVAATDKDFLAARVFIPLGVSNVGNQVRTRGGTSLVQAHRDNHGAGGGDGGQRHRRPGGRAG